MYNQKNSFFQMLIANSLGHKMIVYIQPIMYEKSIINPKVHALQIYLSNCTVSYCHIWRTSTYDICILKKGSF